MSMISAARTTKEVSYPTSDGKPMAETDWHRVNMTDSIDTLSKRYEDDPNVCVSGNMLMYYVAGNPRKHVSPDVFAVFGIPKRLRGNFLIWEEGKAPDVIFEFTSKSTRKEDVKDKYVLYQDVLKVREYFLFDPLEDYLDPPMQGFRLVNGVYETIKAVDSRLPSEMLGLHLERDGWRLRFYDPVQQNRLPILREEADLGRKALSVAKAAQEQAQLAQKALGDAQEEIKQLRRELEQLRQQSRGNGKRNGNQPG